MITLHRDYRNLPPDLAESVVAIGNFDGVHAGHRALAGMVRDIAAREGLSPCILTFEPHPREFFQPAGEPFRLTLLPQKLRLFGALGMEHLFAPAFDAAFSALTAGEFIRDVLCAGLKMRHAVVGEDFSFGKNRGGAVRTLEEAGAALGFRVTVVPPVLCPDDGPYSSTRIRDHIRAGRLEDAAALLGRPWEMESPVIPGDRRGRELGFPTANQDALSYVRMPYGIYAARAMAEGEDVWRDAVASFGIRPMFEVATPLLETHIFRFDAEIYGKYLRVRPVKRLRAEMKFGDITELKKQIARDCLAAQAVLESTPL